MRTIVTAVVVAAAIAGAAVFGVVALDGGNGGPDTDDVPLIPADVFVADIAQRWADAWIAGDTETMQSLAVAPALDLPEKVASFRDGLGITAMRIAPRPPVIDDQRATVKLDVAADLEGLGTWPFTTELRLLLPRDAATRADWKVEWGRPSLHPALTGDRRLSVTRVFGERAPLLAADGTPLTGDAVPPALGAQLLSGMGAAFEAELAGTASGDVHVVENGAVAQVLWHLRGRPPAAVRTSIDLGVQRAAEAALAELRVPPAEGQPATVSPNAAIVVLRASTGEVVASASHPVRGFNRALNGLYPPGSTFKIVTSTALLDAGITPDSPAPCPEVATVNGREFRNAEGAALGDIPFRRAFFESCNTAFVQLATGTLQPGDLLAAAESYGFNAPAGLEVPAETSSFPEPSGPVDLASAAIGQGRVLASPLQMARVAATVAGGGVRPLTLRGQGGPVEAEIRDTATLRELMRLVVEQGTGTAAQLPGEPVHGKTGTAEFGTADPPRTHAWFVGFRGDLALAVVVEDGGFGGRVAAPLARQVFGAVG